MVSNPYLVKRRILDEKGNLWGVKIYYQKQEFKMPKARLVEIIQHKIKQVVVDFGGKDQPVSLILYGTKGALRTIKDGVPKNNFNEIKAIKLVTANKLKVLK